MEKDCYIGFRVPSIMQNKFERRFPDRGKRSKVLRALLQMLLEGKITRIEYQETEIIK
jgi:hypothetical protein